MIAATWRRGGRNVSGRGGEGGGEAEGLVGCSAACLEQFSLRVDL